MAYDNMIEAGNKLIANVGTLTMVGKSRGEKISRLKQEIYKGQTEFLIEPVMSIVAGDRIVIATTQFYHDQNEDRFSNLMMRQLENL